MESLSKKMEPIVSIIVPIYNGEKYIQSCVEALIAQEHSNIEIILVDDGSTDDSQKIMEEMAERDSRVVTIRQENSGVSVARNHGIEKSKGDYICFVDVDDYVTSEYVSYMYSLIKETRSDIALVPNAENFIGNVDVGNLNNPNKDDKIKIYSGKEATKELLFYHIKMSCWSKLFSKRLIEEYDIKFQPGLICGEGFNFCTECFLRAEKVAVGYKPIYYYRLDNPNSAMTKFNMKLIRNGLVAIERIESIVTKEEPELFNACCYTKWHTNCDFLNTMIGCNVTRQYYEEYLAMKKCCRTMAKYAIVAPVSVKDKMKGYAYAVAPYCAAKVINKLRPRKFKEKD